MNIYQPLVGLADKKIWNASMTLPHLGKFSFREFYKETLNKIKNAKNPQETLFYISRQQGMNKLLKRAIMIDNAITYTTNEVFREHSVGRFLNFEDSMFYNIRPDPNSINLIGVSGIDKSNIESYLLHKDAPFRADLLEFLQDWKE